MIPASFSGIHFQHQHLIGILLAHVILLRPYRQHCACFYIERAGIQRSIPQDPLSLIAGNLFSCPVVIPGSCRQINHLLAIALGYNRRSKQIRACQKFCIALLCYLILFIMKHQGTHDRQSGLFSGKEQVIIIRDQMISKLRCFPVNIHGFLIESPRLLIPCSDCGMIPE